MTIWNCRTLACATILGGLSACYETHYRDWAAEFDVDGGALPAHTQAEPSGTPEHHGCEVGERVSCDCGSDRRGLRFCQPDVFELGACTCLSKIWPEEGERQEPQCAGAEREVCDERDNDCDGLIDERYVCPADVLSLSDEFVDSVYLVGNMDVPSCTGDILQPFWPEWTEIAYTGFACEADQYFLRKSDGAVFFTKYHGQLYREGPTEDGTLVPTPPCWGAHPAFDGEGRMYYTCTDDDFELRVFRDGARLYGGVTLVIALQDGRSIVRMPPPRMISPEDYVALDSNGRQLSHLSPYADFEGELRILPETATESNNRAYVAFARTWMTGPEGYAQELLIFRLDERSQWELVRRVANTELRYCSRVLADGTAICTSTTRDNSLDALLPDGSVHAVPLRLGSPGVEIHEAWQIILGPREPVGPSAGEWEPGFR